MNTKELFDKIRQLENEFDKKFIRLTELGLIEAWCEVLKKSYSFYRIEEQYLKTQIESIQKELEELNKKEIVWIEGEVI